MTPKPVEERVGILEERAENMDQKLVDCQQNCRAWQVNWRDEFTKFRTDLRDDLSTIFTELNGRLPKWASVGGMVVFALLTGVIGWLLGSR